MANWIETAGGVALPAPELGSSGIDISTQVDGSRNAQGNFVGQVVGGTKLKVSMTFPDMSNEEFTRFLQIFDHQRGGRFSQTFRLWDPRVGDYAFLEMYVGDRHGVPLLVDKGTMRPRGWKDVSANLIEV